MLTSYQKEGGGKPSISLETKKRLTLTRLDFQIFTQETGITRNEEFYSLPNDST